MSQTQGAPQITGKMFLFEQPELLNIEQHRELGIDPAKKPFDFCSKIRAVPLTISEMPEAAKHYPIVFHSADEPMPLAVVGLATDFNLFVDDKGDWEANVYIPGYLRRYPFALASESSGERMALVFDAAYEGVSGVATRKLFVNGQLSEFSKQAMEFARTYEGDRRVTEQAMILLRKFELVQQQSAQYTPAGSPGSITFAQYYGFDEKLIHTLSDERFLEIRRANLLPVIYTQLISMGNWRHLISRRMQRLGLSESEAITPQKLS